MLANDSTEFNPSGKVYGIDLGTMNSAIAHVSDYDGRVEIINNPDGWSKTASAVFFEDGGIVVGEGAKESAYTDPDNFVHLIKREMGTPWRKEFMGKEHTPESISSLILKYMVKGAEMSGHEVKDVVITCPAYFDEAERTATKNAATMVGLNVLSVVDEPVAALIGYGVLSHSKQTQDSRLVVVYHLGGTFDVTVFQISPKGVEIVCADGDHKLGGADWDYALRDLLLDKLAIEAPDVGDLIKADPETRAALITTVEKTKMSLSQKDTASTRITCCDGGKCKVSVTRAEFEKATRDLLMRTAAITANVISKAFERTGIRTISEFLLEGGSTYMPQVPEMINELFKGEVTSEPKLFEPDRVTAKGAAMMATCHYNISAPTQETGRCTSNYGIKVETSMGASYCYNLITKGTPLPCSSDFMLSRQGNERSSLYCTVYSHQGMNDPLTPLSGCKKEKDISIVLNENWVKFSSIKLHMELDEKGNLQVCLTDESGILDIRM